MLALAQRRLGAAPLDRLPCPLSDVANERDLGPVQTRGVTLFAPKAATMRPPLISVTPMNAAICLPFMRRPSDSVNLGSERRRSRRPSRRADMPLAVRPEAPLPPPPAAARRACARAG